MKKISQLIFGMLCTSVLFASCSNKKSNQIEQATVEPEEKVVEVAKIDPQIEKLNKVLFSMSDRFKAEMKNGDPQEFLADLQKVLDAEKSFPQDDISLYYLLIKNTTLAAIMNQLIL